MDTLPTIKEIRAHLGLSQVAFAKRYGIPRRTLEDWEKLGCCPSYVVRLLAKDAGLVSDATNPL